MLLPVRVPAGVSSTSHSSSYLISEKITDNTSSPDLSSPTLLNLCSQSSSVVYRSFLRIINLLIAATPISSSKRARVNKQPRQTSRCNLQTSCTMPNHEKSKSLRFSSSSIVVLFTLGILLLNCGNCALAASEKIWIGECDFFPSLFSSKCLCPVYFFFFTFSAIRPPSVCLCTCLPFASSE